MRRFFLSAFFVGLSFFPFLTQAQEIRNEEVVGPDTLAAFESNCRLPSSIGSIRLYDDQTLAQSAARTSNTPALEIILDVSGSMTETIGDKTKIDWAREAIVSALGRVPDGVSIGLRAFGHRVAKSNKSGSCMDSQLLTPFPSAPVPSASDQAKSIASVIEPLVPKGWTPIGFALRKARTDLAAFDRRAVLLVSDGEETCKTDPIKAAQELQQDGIATAVHTLGFDVDEKTADELRAIASASGGTFTDVRDGDTLAIGLGEALDAAARSTFSCPALFQHPVFGGSSIAEARSIGPGAYTLERHMESKEKTFFSLPVRAGERVTFYGLAARPSISGNPTDGYRETYDGRKSHIELLFYGDDGQPLKNKSIRALTVKPLESETFAPINDGQIVFSVGYDYNDVNKDDIFAIDVVATTEPGPNGIMIESSREHPGALSGGTISGGLGLEDREDAFVLASEIRGKPMNVKFYESLVVSLAFYDGSGKPTGEMSRIEGEATLTIPANAETLVLTDRTQKGEEHYSVYALWTGENANPDWQPTTVNSQVDSIVPDQTDPSEVIKVAEPDTTQQPLPFLQTFSSAIHRASSWWLWIGLVTSGIALVCVIVAIISTMRKS